MSLISSQDFSNIKVIGFDLDQTLYPKSPKIDEAIQSYIYRKIADHIGCSIEHAQELFTDLYQGGKGLSGSQTLTKLGIPNPKEIVQEALENADIAEFLLPDIEVINLLNKLKQKYQHIDLITGSIRHVAEKKLKKLNIPLSLFDQIITGEVGKSDGSSYREWLKNYPQLEPEQFLYIGDREKSDYWIPKDLGICCALVNITSPNSAVSCLQLKSLSIIEQYLLLK